MRILLAKSLAAASALFLCGLVWAAEIDPESLARAHELRLAQRYQEAKQIYSDWIAAHPDDGKACFELGYTLFLQSYAETDAATAAAFRREGREMGLRAERLKCDDPLLPALLGSTDATGTDLRASYSPKPEVNALIKQAETAFAKGQMDEALRGYQAALTLDPFCYKAALFSGDAYFGRKDYGHAIEWFSKAVGIDPNIETAHRYWGDALMKRGRPEEALTRYIDAVIAEPHSRIPRTMLSRIAQAQQPPPPRFEMGLPRVKVSLENEKIALDLPPDVGPLLLAYGLGRSKWLTTEREKSFPKGSKPRHSVHEEVYGLEMFLQVAEEMSVSAPEKVKPWQGTVDTLKLLKSQGLLHAFVLLDRADEGIVKDYAAYRMEHRDELARYMRVVWLGQGKKIPDAAASPKKQR